MHITVCIKEAASNSAHLLAVENVVVDHQWVALVADPDARQAVAVDVVASDGGLGLLVLKEGLNAWIMYKFTMSRIV